MPNKSIQLDLCKRCALPRQLIFTLDMKDTDLKRQVVENDVKIDHSFISTWHPKYDEIASDEDEYKNLVILTNTEIREKCTVSRQTFIRILNWKSPRVKGIVRLDEFSVYGKGISAAYSAEENEKLKILIRLYGIGTPVGSTILHFIYPNSFPIIDIRTAETLYYACRIKSKSTDFSHYASFRSEMLKIAKENPSFTLREIDRALSAYHKIYLSPKLRQNIKKKERGTKTEIKIKDKALSVFQDRIGEEFSREEIIDLVVIAYPGTNRSSVIPSDYCYNLINATLTFDLHIFESLGEGRYKFLGPNYPYTGPIYWKGEQVGKWEEDTYQLWKDPRKR